MTIWLKNIGASADRLPPKWYDEGSEEGEFRWFVRFSEAFPGKSIAKGDLLLYHAFITGQDKGRIVGVARVSSDEPEWAPRSSDDQWPWLRRSVTPLLIVPLGGHGPLLEEVGIEHAPQGGYKEIDEAQLAAAVEQLARNALPGKSLQ